MLSADERGFTMIEMLIAMTLGIAVLATAGTLLTTTTRRASDVAVRVDATARARVAVDGIVRDLNGEVCLSPTQPPIIAGTGRSVTFTADLTGLGGPPSKVQLTYDPNARTETRLTWTGTGLPPSTTWPANATTTSQTLTGALVPADGRVFHYFAYNPLAPSLALTELGAGSDPGTALSTADLKNVVRIAVSLGAKPDGRATTDPRQTFIYDDAWVGTAEGDNAALGPQC